MFKKIFTIVVPVLAITAAILLFGIKVYNDSYSTFHEDGYVLGFAEGKDANKYYFLKENKYKVNDSKDEVVFLNTEDEEITIPSDTFVHYTDGSIATFKKAVVLNLPNVKNSTLQFYNVYDGSVFTKASDGHQIDHLDHKLAFKDFLIKVTENKYMIVGSGLTVKYGDEEKVISDGYVEIEYMDGNIIKITNQDLNIKNISKDLSVVMDGITVDLLNKKIVYDGETKVNLGEITIDSDDNIEIIPEEEKKKEEIEDDSLSVEHFENQPITAPNVNIGGMQSGVVDTSTKRPDEVVEENETVPDAEFDVQGITVTVKSVNVSIKVKDEAGVLTGDMSWKIVENSTNLIVCMGTIEKGTTNFGFDCGGLAPETNYSVIVRSGYTKNDVNYEKDFVQKTFVTKSMGLTIEKDYVRSGEVAFLIEANGHSSIKSFNYDLIGPEGAIIQNETYTLAQPADTGVDVPISLVFNTTEHYKIRSNTDYTLKIYEIVYGNEELSNTYFISKKLRTLKTSPKFGDTTVAINKQSSKFTLYLNNVKDPDNGAINYRADIYELGKENSKADIVTTREATTSSTINVDVDGKIINRNTNYRAKLYLTFFDNEMEYEIYLGTQDMIMNSVVGPSVTFEKTEITHERIEGKLTINDTNETINLSKPIDVIVQNRTVGSSAVTNSYEVDLQTLPNKKSFTIPINDNGLKSNTSYLYTIMGWINYNDENGYVYAEIGTFWVNTSLPTKLAALITDLTGESTETQFKINFKLGVTEADTQGENPNEVNTMVNIKFRVRAEDYDLNSECLATNRCWERTFTDNNADDYESTLRGMFFENAYEFTPGSFNIDESDLTYGNYIFEVVNAFDYTEHKNDLPIINSQIPFNPNASAKSVIKNKIFHDEVVLNNKAIIRDYEDPNLYSDTIIGYKIVPDIAIPNVKRSEYKLEYTLMDLTTNKTHVLTDSEITKLYTESQDDGNNAIAILFKDYKGDANGFVYNRGHSYALKYCVTYNIGVPDETQQTACAPTYKAFKTQPKKQSPSIGVYLKSRDTAANQRWQYYINDVDSALINDNALGITGQYGTATGSSWSQITCGESYTETRNCLAGTDGTFGTKLAAGSLVVKTNALLLQGAADSSYGIIDHVEEIRIVDEMLFYNVVNNIDMPTYKLEMGDSGNDIKFKFSGYTLSTLKKYVAHVKLKFIAADGTTAIIYKDMDNKDTLDATNAELSVDFSEISALMGKGTIRPEISFVYDRELPGFDTADTNDEGYVIEEAINGATSYQTFESKTKIFKNVSFDYQAGTLSFDDIKGNSYIKNLQRSAKGMFYNNASGYPAYINVKVLSAKEVACSEESVKCDFSFDSIRPTFYLEDNDIEPVIGGVRIKPSMVVDDSIKNKLTLVAKMFKQNDDGTCQNIVEKQYTYSYGTDIFGKSDFTISEMDLAKGQSYCLVFTYKLEDNVEKDFFYGAVYHNAGNPDRRVYNFETLAKPTITDFKIRYDTGTIKSTSTSYDTAAETAKQHDEFNRSLTATFTVDTLENYDGFDFTILDKDFNEITNIANIKQTLKPIETSDTSSTYTTTFQIDSSSTFQTLETNKVYYFSIIAYQDCTSGLDCVDKKRMLEPTNQRFVFYINKPTVKIQRIDSEGDELGEFSFQVTINDKYRAVGGYSLKYPVKAGYTIQVMNDTGLHKVADLELETYWTRKTYHKIDICKGSTICEVYVTYNADTTNTGVKLAYNEIKQITIGSSADIGQSSIISTSTSGVRIGYTDSYMITSIKTIDYTISSNATGTSNAFTDISTVWATDESGSYYYLDINLPLTRGTYTLEISYKDAEGKLVDSESYDIIIN